MKSAGLILKVCSHYCVAKTSPAIISLTSLNKVSVTGQNSRTKWLKVEESYTSIYFAAFSFD